MAEKKIKNKKVEKKIMQDKIETHEEIIEPEIKETEEEKIAKQKLRKKQNKQVIIAGIIMIIILVVAFGVPFLVRDYFSKFTFDNLQFQKTKQGQINYFSAMIPLANQAGQIVGDYPINLKNDPRTLATIKTNINNSQITFIRNNITYIGVDSDSPKCSDDIAAAARLASFLNGFAGINVAGGLDDPVYANASRIPYVTCENYPNNTVIMLKFGNETSIDKVKENCYQLTYIQCDMPKVTEEFQMMILKYYMSYFKIS